MVLNDSGRDGHYTSSIQLVRQPTRRYVQEPIAVVGMACRLPGNSNSPHALWEFLEREGIADNVPPASRFRIDTHHDGSKKPNTMRSPGGMFLENIDPKKFDAAFFSIGKTDAIAMDPQQRQLLEVVYECLENAGITLDKLDGEAVGCFVGSYGVDYADMQARDPDDRAPSVTIGVGRAILSNRISHFLNIHGPSMTIDTACSGSLVGLDVACRYLSSGEINGALIAGANLYLSPEHNMDSGPMKGASSLSGRCHTFDKKADGYIKAEAINCVMLKRLSDAERDGDPIRAIIRGTATNSDGKTPGIASPSAEAQALATRSAYANAGIADFSATGYVEMHGTGTQAGDPQEVKGVASVFAATRPVNAPLIIGSIKSNIGHSEPAAGISGLIKAILAVENGQIPGNPTFIDPNPNIDFKGSRVRATRYTIPWTVPAGVMRRVSVSSFGYGGSNAHAIVDQVPAEKQNFVSSFRSELDSLLDDDDEESQETARPRLLVFSANDQDAITAYTDALHKHLLDPRISVDIDNLAYTLSERRTRHFHRSFLVAKDMSLDAAAMVYGKRRPELPRIAFIFTGQGAQWSQMGSSLLRNFPEARTAIERLDGVLKGLKHPPTWSLMTELTEPRDPLRLRQPEFSQPLVTALQIAIVTVFRNWGVHADAVIGHSSGEIAAAYTAGLLTEENAVKAAYYRGYAAKATQDAPSSSQKVGMMAAGLDAQSVQPYLEQHGKGVVSVSCYNSPQSVTLSGPTEALEAVRIALVEDKHFARMLQVDMAYHSPFMAAAGDEYVRCLEAEHFTAITAPRTATKMFSSVEGTYTNRPVDIDYWKSNMVQPVLFEQALHSMLTSSKEAPDFLIEIGPSCALAGPTNQVKKELPGGGGDISYCAAMTRGKDTERAIFEVAGRLFCAGHNVDLTVVNQVPSTARKMLTDLPNYVWNHNTDYWYENEASQDWRYRKFAHHDLLGSKVLGTSWQAPTWKKTLRLADLPWLKDHCLGPEVVFPGAGYMCMAIEAMMQTDAILRENEESSGAEQQVRLRNVSFDRALVLEEGKETRIMLTLAPFAGQKDAWYYWVVRSLVEGTWADHCKGQVRIERDVEVTGRPIDLVPLRHPTPGVLWYKSMSDVGYNFGTTFRKLLETETTSGSRKCRSRVDMLPPTSAYIQSYYPVHPTVLDGCMQTCAPGLWRGIKSSVNAVLVPAILDDLVVRAAVEPSGSGIALSESVFAGPGRTELTKNYASSTKVFDAATGNLVVRLTGLRYHMLDFQDTAYAAHQYSRLVWAPDVTLSPQASGNTSNSNWDKVQEIADFLAHKKSNAKVVEASIVSKEASSVWLDGLSSAAKARNAFQTYTLLTSDAGAVVEAQSKYESIARTAFQLLDISKPSASAWEEEPLQNVDLVILRVTNPSPLESIAQIIENVNKMLRPDGHLLVLGQNSVKTEEDTTTEETITVNTTDNSHGFEAVYAVDCGTSRSLAYAHLAVRSSSEKAPTVPLDIIQISKAGSVSSSITAGLAGQGWDLREVNIVEKPESLDQLRKDATVLVLSELDKPQLPSLDGTQWTAIQQLLQKRNRIVWVSEGAQWQVRNPDGAMIHGLCRSVRSEDPSVRITTLDLENARETQTAVSVIDQLLRALEKPSPIAGTEGEYVERGGVFHVSRILRDDAVNAAEQAKTAGGAEPVDIRLHEASTTVRMIAERVGSIDSLHYVEVDAQELPLPENTVEVELQASALNFKDVAVTMGIVPENHHLLGLEGAGRVRRVGKGLRTPFSVGQRVLVFEKGTFANRIIATTERTIALPEWLSFEEAATLPSVYLTALYSLFNLSNVKTGDRVLIHSATGGLGIASIQICRAVGAEVYATVGQDVKKQFLIDHFGIPADHIFHSRNAEFEAQIMESTAGYGVDIILNSLTGDLLDASWRCIADGGTMVELGKKDHIQRNTLAMEPFARNASYRCFDMSHKHVTDQVIAVLMRRMMDMIEARVVKPISPIKLFPYSDIPSAVRYMRSANHIGKIIISNKDHTDADPLVPVRPAPRHFHLRGDVSYLMVGGLRGLCGSLAVDLARHGARHLVILGRSGYDDPRSQAILKDLDAEGCEAVLVRGDVARYEDVRLTFTSATRPIAGVIQGAMVLRDKPFELMSHNDYTTAITAKVAGTWNLHKAALELDLDLDFFTTLSSISGLIGQPAQANYAAANVFLDNFAYYRRGLGLQANSVNLGAIEDVGYMAEYSDLISALETAAWTPINEALFYKIVHVSIQQQQRPHPLNPDSCAQLITSIAVPQSPSSNLLSDARFSSLIFGDNTGSAGASGDASGSNKEIQALLLQIRSGADVATVLPSAVQVANTQLMTTLRLDEPLEPAKPLSSYGLDSLGAVEFRNWARAKLGAELTTLEITSVPSLLSLAEKIVTKIQASIKP